MSIVDDEMNAIVRSSLLDYHYLFLHTNISLREQYCKDSISILRFLASTVKFEQDRNARYVFWINVCNIWYSV